MLYEIEVTRIGYAHKSFQVEAETWGEAVDKAEGLASDEAFSEHSSEYSYDSPQKPKDTGIEAMPAFAEAMDYATLLACFIEGIDRAKLQNYMRVAESMGTNLPIVFISRCMHWGKCNASDIEEALLAEAKMRLFLESKDAEAKALKGVGTGKHFRIG